MMRKHLALPILAVTVLLLVTLFVHVNAKQGQRTFYLQDIVGDRSALGDVVISGEILDGYHRLAFELDSERTYTETEVYSVPQYYYDGIRHFRIRLGDLEVEVHGTYNNYTLKYWDISDPNTHWSGSTRVNTSVNYTGVNQPGSVTYTNQVEYGVTMIGDHIYFTIPTTGDYTGTNGIYKIDINSEERGQAITTFSLEQNSEENAPDLHVLGLEAVGDKLALILVEGDQLIIRGFETDGQWIGEAVIDDFALPRYEDHYPRAERHYESYESFSDAEEMVLNLIFRSSLSTDTEMKRTMVSVGFLDDLLWSEVTKASHDQSEQYYRNDLTQLNYIDGKLYLLKSHAVTNEQIRLAIYDQYLYLYVYEAGELIYQGEIVSDINDDLIRVMNRGRDGYGYSQLEHRHFNHLNIKRLTME